MVSATAFLWTDPDEDPHWHRMQWIPFSQARPTPPYLFDVVINVLLYVPLGYLSARAQARPFPSALGRSLLLAVLLSGGTELIQLFTHNRFPSTTDLFNNVVGALLGAFVTSRRV